MEENVYEKFELRENRAEDFVPREYQVEILEKALKHNTIVYLPTGSGKTFIAAMLIKYKSQCLLKKYTDGGKRTFFLVNTVALVSQQAESLRRQLPLEIGEYCGYMGVDYWNADIWKQELDKNQVLVMTAQVFLNMLHHGYISLPDVNLLIMDECHHAVNHHAMRQIMQQFEGLSIEQQPHILGLTATLLNSNCKSDKVESEIHSLEVTLQSKIVSAVNEDMVQVYSTNPVEKKVYYPKMTHIIPDYIPKCISFLNNVVESVPILDSSITLSYRVPGATLINDGKTIKKKLINCLKDIEEVANQLGIYAASKAALAKIILLERLKHSSPDLSASKLYSILITKLHCLRKQLQIELNKEELHLQPLVYSSSKLQKLLEILKDFDPQNFAIVFVQKRITAQVLYYILKDLHSWNESFEGVRPDFIVGFNCNPFNDNRELYFEKKRHMLTLKKFNMKETNVLFASDVLEEGIDIRLCNYVIKFDEPKTFRSYIQSKGRARDPKSKYILMVECGGTFDSNYQSFKQTELKLKLKLCGEGADLHRVGGVQSEANRELYVQEAPPFFVNGVDGPRVTAYSAISLVNRYCSLLPQDKFSKLTPFWWLERIGNSEANYVAKLQLPINCPIKEIICGSPCENKMAAKRNVALLACKLLYEAGELDENLLPRGCMSEILNDKKMYPMWDYDDTTPKHKPGSKKCRRIYDKQFPNWVCGCRPKPGVDLYMHTILMTPNYEYPESHRQRVFFDLLKSKRFFSILTTNKWPRVCEFPMFMNVGEIKINVKVNMKTLQLSENEIKSLVNFHSLLFTDVLPIVKKFVTRDNDNQENAYLIVPTIEDEDRTLNIDWHTVNTEKNIPEVKVVSREARQNLIVTEDMYNGKIVIPWYRPSGSNMRYVVTKVCFDQSPESQFPSETYQSYAQYFNQRYSQKIVNMNQPLIEVRAISSKINCLLPRGKSRHGPGRRRKDEEDFEETLVPELCSLLTFPAVYMLKVTLLPSVLHRLHYLLLAEELRQKISVEVGLGQLELNCDSEWEPLKIDTTALQDQNCDVVQSTVKISDMLDFSIQAITKERYPWGDEKEPVDIEKNLNVDLISIIHYENFISKPIRNNSANVEVKELNKAIKIDSLDNPVKLSDNLTLHKSRESQAIGPQQCEILQAITGITANDIVNYERLETLGDSFLKFAVSLSLFINFKGIDEGKLTQVKSKIIGNRNLFYCGRNIQLGNILKVYDFVPSDWNAPGFTLLRTVKDVMKIAKIPSSVLYQLSLSKEERDSGELLPETLTSLHDLMINSVESEDSTHSSLTVLGQQAIPDKTLADAVEALIGVYLKSCGIVGAFKLIRWLGILPDHKADIDLLLRKPAPTALLSSEGCIENHLMFPNLVEDILGYSFNDKSFLLQALSHSSYAHAVTDCYQRLEFLGDAILDFLITAHIYDKCGNLSPGELTDLRSALVNNVTFACLIVRFGLHKFILARACTLTDIINKFVQHQESRNHVIGAEVLFLVEENDIQVAESIDVPKVLGDLFESLAAAVYLDSGKDLKTVWNIFYKLMAKEIDEFSQNVPKNHIRLLYEQFPSPSPKFGKATILPDESGVMVPLEVTHNNDQKIFHGIGENKAQAKLAAAKLALRHFHTPELKNKLT